MSFLPMRSSSRPIIAFAMVAPYLEVCAVGAPLGSGIAQPSSYQSQSKTCSLDVRPHDRHGDGGATYRFTRNGEEVWSTDLPYALRAVTVTDSGFVVGIAYHNEPGARDRETRNSEEHFHFIILDPSGMEVVNDADRRHPVHHSFSEPFAQQVLVDEANDHVILRVLGAEQDCSAPRYGPPWGGPSWRVYRLSDGRRLDEFVPHERDAEMGDRWRIVDASLVPDTQLIVQHVLVRAGGNERITGAFLGLNGALSVLVAVATWAELALGR